MLSTMQDVPLTVSRILAHGSTVHGESQVITWTGGDPHRRSFAEIGRRAAQLAHALRDELSVAGGERVGTLMWNNAEHMEAYLAIPSMGAVLHTLNLRLPAEQLVWIINHAEDRVVLVNGTLLPLLAPLLPQLPNLRHIVVAGPGDRSVLEGAQARVHNYDELIAGRPESYAWPEIDERRPRRSATPPGPPETPRACSTATVRSICTPCRSTAPRRSRSPDGTSPCRSCRCFTSMPGACRTPPS